MKTLLLALASCCVAMFVACGAPKCSASNCVGCCDLQGTCQAGSTVTACGLSGSVCTQCLASACVNGFCNTTGSGGSNGGGVGGGGATDGGGAGGGGGGGAVVPSTFRAYNLSISGATLPASCYRNNMPPANPTVAPRTLEVLVWNVGGTAHYIALGELLPYQLGDAPTIRPPEAVEGTARILGWVRNTQTPINDQYTEARQMEASFAFADLTASSTTGTLSLSSQYACIRNRGDCPVDSMAAADAASCNATLTFSAQAVPFTAKWATPEAAVTGATKYLVSLDYTPVKTISVPSCFRNNSFPAGRGNAAEFNMRDLDVWQVFTIGPSTYLRTTRQTLYLGDAPAIRIDADLSSMDGGAFVLNTSRLTPFSGLYEETRSTAVSTSPLTADVVPARIDLSSSYSCTPGTSTCPAPDLAAADAASCQSTVNAVAVRLP